MEAISILLPLAVLGAFLFTCSCNTPCERPALNDSASQAVATTQHRCCPSYKPTQESEQNGCCSDEVSCNLNHVTDYLPPQTDTENLDAFLLAKELALEPIAVSRNTTEQPHVFAHSATGPPPYLRFEILRI